MDHDKLPQGPEKVVNGCLCCVLLVAALFEKFLFVVVALHLMWFSRRDQGEGYDTW